MAVSQQRVPLRRLAETNSLTAQILSFRLFAVDFNLSESLYEQVRESAKLLDRVEEPDWYLHPSNKMDCIDLVPCSSSEQPVDKLVQICSLKLRNPLNNSGLKACETMAPTSDHEDAERSKRCHCICLRNSESPIIEEDTTSIGTLGAFEEDIGVNKVSLRRRRCLS